MADGITKDSQKLASSGVAGLDDVLAGGFSRRRLFLIEGEPGAGKTTLALQFLMEGAARGEPVLHVTLSETEEELRDAAASHDWMLHGVSVYELVPMESALDPNEQNTMFHPSEVELSATTKLIIDHIERLKPTRVVLDSLSELRLLAGDPLRYRRQILAFKQFLSRRGCTALLLDDTSAHDPDLQTQSIAHGVLSLEQLYLEYGSERRRLRVVKYRGSEFRGGYHDYVIRKGGLEVFPRLVASEHRRDAARAKVSSGIAALDQLLGGGLEQATSTLIVGAAGTGKSTLAAQFAAAAADHGGRAALFTFDESTATLLSRCAQLGVNLARHVEAGQIKVKQVDPAELTPGELTHEIRTFVQGESPAVVVIDSLNGLVNSMPEEQFLAIQLHELLMFLGQCGVVSILIGAHQGLIGNEMKTPVDASYLADTIILLRYFETQGEVRKAISVMKKRGGNHERTIREFRLDDGQIRVGQPLREFHGVLTGVPLYKGPAGPLIDVKD